MKFRFILQGTTWYEKSDQSGIWGERDEESTIAFMLEYIKERMKGNWWDSGLQYKVKERLRRRGIKI